MITKTKNWGNSANFFQTYGFPWYFKLFLYPTRYGFKRALEKAWNERRFQFSFMRPFIVFVSYKEKGSQENLDGLLFIVYFFQKSSRISYSTQNASFDNFKGKIGQIFKSQYFLRNRVLSIYGFELFSSKFWRNFTVLLWHRKINRFWLKRCQKKLFVLDYNIH